MLQSTAMMLRLSLSVALVAVAACGGDDEVTPDAAEIADATTSADAPANNVPDGSTSPDAQGTGAACGGFPGLACETGLWCDWPGDNCGADDGQGVCTETPVGCTEEYAPVCGCDGEVHGNACEAHAAGTDLSNLGGCEAPAGYFACGPRFCPSDTSYCEIIVSDVVGIPNDYACRGLPPACGSAADCDCLKNQACGDWCEPTGDGFTLTCPGG